MYRKIIILISLLIFSFQAKTFCQYNSNQNKIWVFGSNAGLNFTSGSPVGFTSALSTSEGSASVCDASGNLLFYTDGDWIYNQVGVSMNTTAITGGTASSTQGAAIAPIAGTNKFYVFSIEAFSFSSNYCKLYYSVVDMSLAGGLGGLESIGTLIDSNLSEKMQIVQGDSCNLWLLVHDGSTPRFKAYKITESGISTTPILSSLGTLLGTDAYTIGEMKVSPNRQRILLQNYDISGGFGTPSSFGTEVYDFNPTTGVVSNCILLNNTTSQYGGEFSPDASKIYCNEISASFSTEIVQYDLSLPTTTAIIASRNVVASTFSPIYTEMRLGPDGKIYLGCISAGLFTNFMDCIASPNNYGAACGYTSMAVTLPGTSTTSLGMPNLYVSYLPGDTLRYSHDTTLCIGPGTTIHSNYPGSIFDWNDGTSGIFKPITAYGTYWVTINNGCSIIIDTIHVYESTTDTTYKSHDTTVCISALPLSFTARSSLNYLWSTGATTPSINVNASGTYWVIAYNDCGNAKIDTFKLRTTPIDSTTHVHNYSICDFDSTTFQLSSVAGFDDYIWNTGATSISINANSPGTYWVKASSFCSGRYDTFNVAPLDISFRLGNDTSICINYPLTAPIQSPALSYLWSTGNTSPINYVDRNGIYWLTISKGICSYSDTIDIQYFVLSQNIPDTVVCKEEPISYTVRTSAPLGSSIMWNDGDTSKTKTFTQAGQYWVEVSKNECAILDSVIITSQSCDCWYDVPTAFTPNKDGENDIIHPLIQEGCEISGYEFAIYNRWGQEVFRSDFKNKGWDGTFNGVPCDLGSYMYSLHFYYGDKFKKVLKTGDITLIR